MNKLNYISSVGETQFDIGLNFGDNMHHSFKSNDKLLLNSDLVVFYVFPFAY